MLIRSREGVMAPTGIASADSNNRAPTTTRATTVNFPRPELTHRHVRRPLNPADPLEICWWTYQDGIQT